MTKVLDYLKGPLKLWHFVAFLGLDLVISWLF